MEKIEFKGRKYEVTERFDVPAQLAADGMREQIGIKGPRGALGLLQVFDNCRRIVWLTGRGTSVQVAV